MLQLKFANHLEKTTSYVKIIIALDDSKQSTPVKCESLASKHKHYQRQMRQNEVNLILNMLVRVHTLYLRASKAITYNSMPSQNNGQR